MKRTFSTLLLSAALTTMVLAQNPNAPGQARNNGGSDSSTAGAALLEAVSIARTTDLSKGGNLAAVEALLLPLNKSQSGSADWQMETAQRLIEVAEQLARLGATENIPTLAKRALQYLGVADNPSRDSETRAAAKTLTAWIYERYLADSDAAQANYEAATQLAPNNGKARESAGRLKDTKENVKQKPVRG